MIKFGIDVELTPEQAAAAEAHWGEDRMDAFAADIQGTIKTFFDNLIKEDIEATKDDEPEEEDGEEVYFLTPIGVVCFKE